MFTRRPKTPDEIRAEIADLERRRDTMLKNAPKHVVWRRVIALIMLVFILAAVAKGIGAGHPSWRHGLIVVAILGLVGSSVYKAWRPGFDPTDPWDASDRLGYDGESPREVQRRIDALAAEMRERG